ncbi:MAG: hypothetical protein WAU76_10450 [Candidatus Sulfotelmatobacter sp.]
MKNFALLFALAVLPLLCSTALAQDESAVNVQASCAHWAKLRVDKHKQFKGGSDDLYETGLCLGYFDGLMDGMDNTGGWQHSDGSVATFQIKRSAIASPWDVIRSFYTYVDANPLAKGKPAWSVLQSVLISNGLATFVPQTTQQQPSALSNECSTGANNVLTQFTSDDELKAIDSPSLVSVSSKLRDCLKTKGLTEADLALLFAAGDEANIVLLARAVDVLDRHALLPELGAERSPSTRNTTISQGPEQ